MSKLISSLIASKVKKDVSKLKTQPKKVKKKVVKKKVAKPKKVVKSKSKKVAKPKKKTVKKKVAKKVAKSKKVVKAKPKKSIKPKKVVKTKKTIKKKVMKTSKSNSALPKVIASLLGAKTISKASPKKKVVKKKAKKVVKKKAVKKVTKKKVAKKKAKKVVKKKTVKKKVSKLKKVVKAKVKKSESELKLERPNTPKELVLEKVAHNPIIGPSPKNSWESWQTFNPGVVLLDGKAHMVYRAIGSDGLSRLGYAESEDLITISKRLPHPVFEHNPKQIQFNIYSYSSGGSWGGCEDPRLVRVGKEDVIYMTYTACDGGLGVGLTSIKVKDFKEHKWNWKKPKIISKQGEVHKNWVIFPEKINGKYAVLHVINPKVEVEYLDDLEFETKTYITSGKPSKSLTGCWDNWIRGVGPTPLKTEEGWLVLYHAIEDKDPGKYKVGAMLLDLTDPTKVLCRSPGPILEPNESYENEGFKSGIVYASGALVNNKKLYVYYGGADSYVCVASANFNNFINEMKKGITPVLKPVMRGKTLNNLNGGLKIDNCKKR